MNVLRWVLFIPAAVLLSEIVRYFGGVITGGLYELLLPETLAMLVKDGFLFFFSGAAFIASGYLIGPSNKALVLKIVNICAVVYYIVFAILTFFMAQVGVAGSFWYPLLLSVAALIGIAFGNNLIKARAQADKTTL
jgi:hypothetical protein